MINYNEKERAFKLDTEKTSYLIRIYPSGHLGHLYYGKRLESVKSLADLELKFGIEVGNQVLYDQADRTFNLNLALLEMSTFGKGDYREPMLHFRFQDGSRLTDFKYKEHKILESKPRFAGLPETFAGVEEKVETLIVTLEDAVRKLEVDLYYSLFVACDVIARRAVVRNNSADALIIEKGLSMNLDLLNEDYQAVSLDGAWINERQVHVHDLGVGILKIDSKKGVSSNDHNPFVAIKEKKATEEYGRCYGFSLVYSGNFEATMEVTPHNLLRILMGINSFDFYWNLRENEEFVTPEVVLTYSEQGMTKLSQNIHELIKRNLIKPDWQNKERPVLLNNWEATSFSFNERKLLKMARRAKKLGIELFVLDDGWFGKRDDDTRSLGDWYPNRRKLPSGIKGLCEKINRLGLSFGIWVEPEMVNPDSDLFRAHPDWVISHPDYKPSLGRNQLVLDLSNPVVREYLFEVLTELFESANITYCKWDMNRNFSDVFSPYLDALDQGGLYHRYYLGLYQLMESLTARFPEILFEACASGGNRFDLGMLYYMPQIWTSDNTDGYERVKIQYGTSLCYPQSVMGAHVSNIPNMQTLRHTQLETRFNIASFGLLGYELDITRLTPYERKVIKKQIAFYKKHRQTLQFGRLVRIKNPFLEDDAALMVISSDGSEAVLGIFQCLENPNAPLEKIRVRELSNDNEYLITNRTQYFNLGMFGDLVKHALPIDMNQHGILFHILKNHYLMPAEKEAQQEYGAVLNQNGFIPKQRFIGTGYNQNVRLMCDFGSRLYTFTLKEEQEA